MNVAHILKVKGSAVISVKPTDSIGKLTELLREKRVGAAVVSTDGHTIDGVITERDVTYGLALYKDKLHALPVSQLMTKAVITCAASDTIAHVASTMQARNIRHVPVELNKRVVGMVSIRDVLNFRVGELQEQTAMLMTMAAEPARVPQDRE